jgi:hypothetical protein
MKSYFLYITLVWLGSLATGCSMTGGGHRTAEAPRPVPKKVSQKVFVHLMPWFESRKSNHPPGTWGLHWTMAREHPDSTLGGKRQIASFYYPMIGPYASGDRDVIEYQLMLMKLAGVDGVFIDWPGRIALYDYPANAANTDSIIARIRKTGLHYAIVYEDQNVGIAFRAHAITDEIEAARQDIRYLATHYFTDSAYEKQNGRPMLLDFGPQTFTRDSEWTAIFSVLKTPPAFYTLWDHDFMARSNTTGQFAWINADNTVSLKAFYQGADSGEKIASAYPGFNPYYEQGGWGGPTFVIPANGTENFRTTLQLALQSGARYIQIPTWNDYGEGTMIEPTEQFGYSLLTTLQQMLGVSFTQKDLEAVSRLYLLRKTRQGNSAAEQKLDEAFTAMAALQMDKARKILKQFD